MPSPRLVMLAVWGAWALSWACAAPWSRSTERRAGWRREIGYRVVTAVGAVLLAVPAHRYEGPLRLWQMHRAGAWICIAAMVCGFAFAWWARVHLGALWSGQVTKKIDHRVVDTGPYAVVRHPIYTGILVAALAMTVAKGTVLAIAGGVILAIGLTMKARLEEEWLTQELGRNQYESYRRRVPMLVPFGPRAR